MNRGFTLLETVIYIALLALVMSGTLGATYELLAGQGRASARDATEEEGGFSLQKFAWMMGQITATGTPSLATPHTHTLDITTASGRMQLCLANSTIWIREGAGACDTSATALTTSNVKVTGLDFTYLPAVSGAPDGIEASTTIDGETFSMTRYLRK